MTLAAIPWLDLSITLLLILFVGVCILMTLIILMQRPKQEGLGAAFGSGVTDQVFGARTTNVLQRGTAYLGGAFFVLALILANLVGLKNQKVTLMTNESPAPSAEVAPAEPDAPKSLTEELPVTPPIDPVTPAVPDPGVPADAPIEQPEPTEVPATPEETPAVEPGPAEDTPAVEETPVETEESPATQEEKTEGQ